MAKNEAPEAIEGSLFCSRTLLNPRVPSVVDGNHSIGDPWITVVTMKAPEILSDLSDQVLIIKIQNSFSLTAARSY